MSDNKKEDNFAYETIKFFAYFVLGLIALGFFLMVFRYLI